VFRRQSLGKTRRQLRAAVDEVGREEAMNWWAVAEDRFTTGKDGSPLARWMMFAMALALDKDSLAKVPPAAYAVGMSAGYSLRACLDTDGGWAVPLDVSMLDTDRILAIASGPVDPESGALSGDDIDVEVVMPAFDYLTVVADGRFEEVASFDASLWNAVVSLATYQLQENVQESGLVRSGRKFNELAVESVLRFGFLTRCLDEALGIETEIETDHP
jgi:hypothetical protein